MLDAVFLIPALPLLGFLTIVVFGRRLGEPLAGWFATAMMGGSFATAVVVMFGLLNRPMEERHFVQTLFVWVPAGDFSVDVGFLVDPLSVTMTLFVTGVGMLIHLYSIGYMHGDENFSKFFLYLNLFAFSMLMLVLGDNLLITFLGWEGVGACSYLLISFWFTSEYNASSGKKAFITNRVGDWGFMVATFLTFTSIGSIRYLDILGNAGQLQQTTATAIVVLLFVGAAGKSAQIPLYLWLPDAMAGPTPVSALIHAATMVTSGVYLLTRMNPVLAESASWAPHLVAWVGVGTAFFAATIAISQNDIKKVLAYSTISQLGYMFLAVGTGAYVAAIFHMVTHAFFKALLFLGAGSVIHGMDSDQDMRHYGMLRKFMPVTAGTFIVGWLAIAGVPPFAGFWSKDEILGQAWNDNKLLWLIGFVTAILTAFYMSREVFLTFYGRYRYADVRPEEIDEMWNGRIAAAEADVAAAEGAATSADQAREKAADKLAKAIEKLEQRQGELTEADESDEKAFEKATKNMAKAEEGVSKAQIAADESGEAAEQARGAIADVQTEVERVIAASKADGVSVGVAMFDEPDTSSIPEADLPVSVKSRREYHPHESPWLMTLPLVVLAALAAVAGSLNLPFSASTKRLEIWLEPSLFGNEAINTVSAGGKWLLAGVAVVGGLVGIYVAVAIYIQGRLKPSKVELPIFAHGWHYDELVSAFMGGPGRRGFDLVSWFDGAAIDGTVNGVGRLVRTGGGQLRRLQSGFIRAYAAMIALGAVGLVIWFLVRAGL